MDVETRVKICRTIEKIYRNQSYADKIMVNYKSYPKNTIELMQNKSSERYKNGRKF